MLATHCDKKTIVGITASYTGDRGNTGAQEENKKKIIYKYIMKRTGKEQKSLKTDKSGERKRRPISEYGCLRLMRSIGRLYFSTVRKQKNMIICLTNKNYFSL